jgi:hypothetical protein
MRLYEHCQKQEQICPGDNERLERYFQDYYVPRQLSTPIEIKESEIKERKESPIEEEVERPRKKPKAAKPKTPSTRTPSTRITGAPRHLVEGMIGL